MRDLPYHHQPIETIGPNFIKGLKLESKSLLNIIVQGKILSKNYDEIEVVLNFMFVCHRDYLELSGVFTSIQKIPDKFEMDDVSIIWGNFGKLCALMK